MASHPELAAEQAYVDRAYELLDKGLADAEKSIGDHGALDRNTGRAMKRALEVLRESRGTGQLVFGRFDIGGEPTYIGRRRVYDEHRDLKVIGWHAPAAMPYYEASPQQPGAVQLKRVFDEEDRRLRRIVDEISPDLAVVPRSASEELPATTEGAQFISDALLNELERTRDGAMREVVSTIQAEQFRIIRAPRESPIIVQGGPGTGKTVVGLHRAAWLAFNHDDLRRQGILVVVPSNTFLSYVAGVLPSLEVTDVHQVDIGALYTGEARVRGSDDLLAARVKGSGEMAAVLRQAVDRRIGNVDGDLVLPLGAERITIRAQVLREVVNDARRRSVPYNDGRDIVRQRLATRAYEIHVEAQREAGRPTLTTEATIRRLTAFANALDRIWPSFSPEELLRSLYASQSRLADAAQDVLVPDDRASLYRPQAERIDQEPWTTADLHCLDELAHMLNGRPRVYGHIVVDEAQDLSPMAARAIARRCPSGSMTVLGDLAQATGSWTRDAWGELSPHLSEHPAEVAELTIGYRVPAEVTELATRQLEYAAVNVSAPISVRRGSGAVKAVLASEPADEAISYATTLSQQGLKVALIVADGAYDRMATAAQTAGFGDGRSADFTQPVTLLPVSSSKGLEFDAVILLEPATLIADLAHGSRWLYVVMTRCTQELHILHSAQLPPGLDHLDRRPHTPDPPADGAPDPDVRRELGEALATLGDDDVALIAQVVRRLAASAGSVQPGEGDERRGG